MTHNRPIRILMYSVLLLCFSLGPALAQSENRILVLPFHAEPITEEGDILGEGLVDLIQAMDQRRNLDPSWTDPRERGSARWH